MRSVWILIAVAACGGSQRQPVEIAAPPAPSTRATLAGPMCANGQTCTCRDESAPGDGGVGEPAEGMKRFEIKAGPAANAIWVTLDDMVLYKSGERATECFYVDLAPGDHKLGVRVHNEGGLGAAVTVREYGAKAKTWYDSVHFACGAPGACSNDELAEQKADFASTPHGIHDPCGSVKVKGVEWATGTEPDMIHPEDLQVSMILDVYKFIPDRAHGTTCERRTE